MFRNEAIGDDEQAKSLLQYSHVKYRLKFLRSADG